MLTHASKFKELCLVCSRALLWENRTMAFCVCRCHLGILVHIYGNSGNSDSDKHRLQLTWNRLSNCQPAGQIHHTQATSTPGLQRQKSSNMSHNVTPLRDRVWDLWLKSSTNLIVKFKAGVLISLEWITLILHSQLQCSFFITPKPYLKNIGL